MVNIGVLCQASKRRTFDTVVHDDISIHFFIFRNQIIFEILCFQFIFSTTNFYSSNINLFVGNFLSFLVKISKKIIFVSGRSGLACICPALGWADCLLEEHIGSGSGDRVRGLCDLVASTARSTLIT